MTELYAILRESARPLLVSERSGKDNRFTNLRIGSTAVYIDAGEIRSKVQWGIHGTEAPISSDIAEHIASFIVFDQGEEPWSKGYYALRRGNGHILAEATVNEHGREMSKLYVQGKERADVVKLFELIRAGETAPESVGGRRGLIRDMRSVIDSQKTDLADIQLRFQTVFDEGVKQATLLGEVTKERDTLKDEVVQLNKPKKGWVTRLYDWMDNFLIVPPAAA